MKTLRNSENTKKQSKQPKKVQQEGKKEENNYQIPEIKKKTDTQSYRIHYRQGIHAQHIPPRRQHKLASGVLKSENTFKKIKKKSKKILQN